MNKARLCIIAGVLMIASSAFAQGSLDSYIEILRSDLQTQKKALITEAMQLTDAEAKVFWPMYRDYENDQAKLNDRRIAVLKDYASNYETMTDKKTEEIMKDLFKFQKERIDVREEYYKKAVKLMGLKRAAQWAQIENQIQNLVEAKISSEIPLLK